MQYAIHCETEDLAKQVLQIAHDAGLRWVHVAEFPMLEEAPWLIPAALVWDKVEGFTLNLNDGCIKWSTSNYWNSCGFTIVKAQDFIAANERYLLNRESI